MKNLMVNILFVFLFGMGCSSQKTTTSTEQPSPQNQERPANRGGERKTPPSIEEIFQMDANKDGKLSKTEVKGRLQKDFDKVDANSDGFISKAELENAPKPQRGQRPSRGN